MSAMLFVLLLLLGVPAHATPPLAAPYASHAAVSMQSHLDAVSALAVEACTEIAGEVVLDADLDCAALTSGATLDLSGHTVGRALAAGDDATLRNGTVDGGIAFLGCRGCLVENVALTGGAWSTLGVDNVARRIRLVGNEFGLDLYFGGSCLIEDSFFQGNVRGVWMNETDDNVVRHNVFVDNGVGVSAFNEDFLFTSHNRVEGNLFMRNGYGVALTLNPCDLYPGIDCLLDNAISHNVFVANERAGISIATADFCDDPGAGSCPAEASGEVAGNFLFWNGFGDPEAPGDGLRVAAPPEVADGFRVAHNAASYNADLGIDAAGVIDGHGNRARGNRSGVDCVGVVCTGRPVCGRGMHVSLLLLPLAWVGSRLRPGAQRRAR